MPPTVNTNGVKGTRFWCSGIRFTLLSATEVKNLLMSAWAFSAGLVGVNAGARKVAMESRVFKETTVTSYSWLAIPDALEPVIRMSFLRFVSPICGSTTT
ncbi:hypothetical protein QFC19_000406 [Naganishia cerealis]|uniref:Uncharacterized protein n=1 Tax=Naganishia cerealis TaxID=610337 RepID=A0ACC2WN19_9TREE|nr:hypothetical protein QFC19_000406 [Naganishia cerealis]